MPQPSLYADQSSLKSGELFRYNIKISGCSEGTEFCFKLKNKATLLLKPLSFTSPLSFYVDCRPFQYDEDLPFSEEIQFNADVKPDDTYCGVLTCNENSAMIGDNCYGWTIDVMSQVALMSNVPMEFDFQINPQNTTTSTDTINDSEQQTTNCTIAVNRLSIVDLWEKPPPSTGKSVHLVIITHGIFSNTGCDMLYLRDKLEKRGLLEGSNLMIRGFMDNIGKSSKGIEYLGKRVAKFVVDTVENEAAHGKKLDINKISFIGHSLGGPVQAFAIAYIYEKHPDFFKVLKPENLIIMAAPMLGVAVETPSYASMAMDMGGLGKTGRDLTFKHRHFIPKKGMHESNKPLLETIPTHPIFQLFKNRTLYANVLNDGIVPLRTSALLYLDWRSVERLYQKYREKGLISSNQSEKTVQNESHSNEIPILKERPRALEEGSDAEAEKNEEEKDLTDEPASPVSENSMSIITKLNKKKYSKYNRFQVLESSSESECSSPVSDSASSRSSTPGTPVEIPQSNFLNLPPRASALLSVAQCMYAPFPSQDYIMNPSHRGEDVILYDKIYTPDIIPQAHYADRKTIKKIIYPHDKSHRKEERIAAYWHHNMDWRKVLVILRPDSHNSIVVRRRFVNLYGNVVIKNLVETHF